MNQSGGGGGAGGGAAAGGGELPKKMAPQSVVPLPSRRTCTACKASKVKCDRAAPVCGRCARLRLTCVQQPRAQGRPIKYNNAGGDGAEGGGGDRVLTGRDLKPGRTASNESSTQWAADYMAFTFSNLLKAGAVHRYKTFAVLRVWMLFSLYYGVDLTKGFLSVALALMDASIQDLQRLPETVVDAPMAHPASESSSNPLDPSVLQPFIASLDDGVSAVICCVGCRGGTGKVFCNDKFKATFFSSEDLTYRTLNESTLPVYMYACIIAPEDRAEFVDSLTNVCFGTQTALPQVTHIVKVLDKHGNEFLAIVRLRCLTLNNGEYGADILTIEPAPTSKYVLQTSESSTSSMGPSDSQPMGLSGSTSGLSIGSAGGASASGGSASGNSSVDGDASQASGAGAQTMLPHPPKQTKGRGRGRPAGSKPKQDAASASKGGAGAGAGVPPQQPPSQQQQQQQQGMGGFPLNGQGGMGGPGGPNQPWPSMVPFDLYSGGGAMQGGGGGMPQGGGGVPPSMSPHDPNAPGRSHLKRPLPDDMSGQGGGGGLPPPHSRPQGAAVGGGGMQFMGPPGGMGMPPMGGGGGGAGQYGQPPVSGFAMGGLSMGGMMPGMGGMPMDMMQQQQQWGRPPPPMMQGGGGMPMGGPQAGGPPQMPNMNMGPPRGGPPMFAEMPPWMMQQGGGGGGGVPLQGGMGGFNPNMPPQG